MRSSGWHALGTGDVLGHLRADLGAARTHALVVGPWIDAFFADALIAAIPGSVELRVVTRPMDATSAGFVSHAQAALERLEARPGTSIRFLASLHAKVIIIDDGIVYCGSANWYRYSLEESREIVLRGRVIDVPDVLDELQVIWDQAVGEPLRFMPRGSPDVSDGCREEVLDPVAAAKLREVRGAFVIKPPTKRR